MLILLSFGTIAKAQESIIVTQQTQRALTFQIENRGVYDFYSKISGSIDDFAYQGQFNTDLRNNFTIENLSPASIYEVRVMQNGETIKEGLYITQSASTGEIKHYFNHQVETGATNALIPDGTSYSEVEKQIRDLIKGAKKTIDYCAYNTNVTSIINALIDAQQRGVRIRVITDNGTSNTSLQASLPFEVLKDGDDALMHNKFIIVDNDDVLNATVVTGSMNFTFGQMNYDPNHLLFIKDQSLSKAYTIEFEEMWGSNTAVPNLSKSKFSSNKTDNTPHIFNIGGIPVECYFSPSDNTTTKIKSKLRTADASIDLSLLILTNNDIKNQLIDNAAAGIRINGIIDDGESSNSVINELRSAGANIIIDPSNNIYHYKMAMIDAEAPSSKPTLITGSHNWTFSAETKNDENLLVIQDYGIANLYKRAMYYWWNKLTSNVDDLSSESIHATYLNGMIDITTDEAISKGTYYIFNSNGQVMAQGGLEGSHITVGPYFLPTNAYFLVIENKGKLFSQKIINL
jgi:phosphatidylserine/phosphatidylglycerophosphate/cardiolipin synthase-like enzyme